MATVSFKLDDLVKAEFDHIVERNGLNASEILRQALETKLDELRQRSVGTSLTKKERLLLYNQYAILMVLAKSDYERKDYEQKCEALMSGYEREYDELFDFLSDGVPRAVCQEVLDILDLHRALMNFYVKQASDSYDLEEFRFIGFDGNEETSHYSYCRYFVEELGRYSELSDDRNRGLNSHWPILPTYQSMLTFWKQLPRKWDLSVKEVAELLARKNGSPRYAKKADVVLTREWLEDQET
jgi:uncharacterized protein